MAMHQQQQSPRDDIMIMVPNSAVGALIGAGGSHIKQIIRDSNAYVTVRCPLICFADLKYSDKTVRKSLHVWNDYKRAPGCYVIRTHALDARAAAVL